MRGWVTKTIGEACELVNGGTPKTGVAEFWGGQHQWVTPAEMGKRSSPYIDATERTLTDAGLANCSASPLPSHSIIMSSRAPIGHLVINTVPMSFNQGCKGLIPKPGLDHKFLYYFLLTNVELLNALGTGATFKELSGGKLKEVTLPIPPLAEQKRIVAILDDAFEGIARATANAERNFAEARKLFERAIVKRFAEIPVEKTAPVRDLASDERGAIRTGPFGSQLLHSEFVDDGPIAVLGIDNVVDNEFTWKRRRYITAEKYGGLQRYTVKPGDVLISIMGTCGRCAVVPDEIEPAINSKHLCCITLDRRKCLPAFLHTYFLLHPVARAYLAAQSKGSIMDGLNMGIIQDMPVELPSLQNQKTIGALAETLREKCEEVAGNYKRKCDRLAELQQAILHKAFSGQLTGKEAIAA